MKPRVLIINKFYYPRGGDCIVAMNMETLFKEQGYDVAIFAMNHENNNENEWSTYFASTINFSGGIKDKILAFKRLLGIGDINTSYRTLLNTFKPDVVFLHNIHSYLSPQIARLSKQFGCKVFWTLHDYKLLCPSYNCLRDGKICKECFKSPSSVLKHKCMKGSTAASLMAYLEELKWMRLKLESYVDTFICPSQFMKNCMIEGGFNIDKLKVVCNCISLDKYNELATKTIDMREDFYCYIGRLSQEKGIMELIDAAKTIQYKLKIAGDGPLKYWVERECKSTNNIEYIGKLNSSEVCETLSKTKFSIIPSIWNENNPLSVIESLSNGTPVVGSNFGGIPELIDNNEGIIFNYDNPTSIMDAIQQAWIKKWNYEEIKSRSIERFSPQKYFKSIMELL